jgi:hypothetical protein
MKWREWGRKGGQATRGEAKGTAKLTETDVREILSSCEPASVIARRFNTSPGYVRDIRHRRWWKHVQ